MEENKVDYKKEIIKLLDKISNETYYKKIYSFIKVFV